MNETSDGVGAVGALSARGSALRRLPRLLVAVWRRWGRRGVVFLGLDMQDLTGDARDFLRRQSVTYPSIRDPGKGVAKSYGATGIPETYFISARGRVVAHVIGVVSDAQIDSATAAALTGRAIGRKRGGALRPPR